MAISKAQYFIESLADSIGVKINGTGPSDIIIHNKALFSRIIQEGSLGFGEAYMEGWWDSPRLDELFDKILSIQLERKIKPPKFLLLKQLLTKFINFQTKTRSQQVAKKHYDLGNDLFSAMLDKRMIYSCAYWHKATTLEEAQKAKLDLICHKLKLQKDMRILDIGCGWGGLARYAAENYDVKVVGVTISKQQYEYAKKYCDNLPVEIYLQDYRDVKGSFDRIVSVGMFEHVGPLNYQIYMQKVHQLLDDDGLFLLHTIGKNHETLTDEWIQQYIFPNGMLPTVAQISKASEKLFVMEDWHNFGADYDPTLMAWFDNFHNHWDDLKNHYSESFYRMWKYYLLSCAGSFRSRANQLWQIVFSKNGIRGGYHSPR